MPKRTAWTSRSMGFLGPGLGSRALALSLLALGLAGCNDDEETRILAPVQVAMTDQVAPVYEDDELTIYEVKKGVQFPIIAPSASEMSGLEGQAMDPYGRKPWITLDDVRVQLSWTVTNLDNVPRDVEVIIDPWNEFGRYWPGLTLVDAENGEFMPNLSGIDQHYVLEPVSKGEKSRRHGVFTYEDMDELARDFGTVMNLILYPPTSYPGGMMLEEGESALPAYVNHAFDTQNHSERDPLIKNWIPPVVAGLTGVDMGLRTREAANVALEVVVEITDKGSNKVRKEGESDTLLPPTTVIVTIGTM